MVSLKNDNPKLKRLRILGEECKVVNITMNTKCNIRCKHCYQNSDSNNILINESYVLEVINQLKNTDWIISFLGGEVTLDFDILKKYVSLCKINNIQTCIFTNGWWAFDNEMFSKVEELKLDYLILSHDKFHQEFIPFKNLEYINQNIKYTQPVIAYCFSPELESPSTIIFKDNTIIRTISNVGRHNNKHSFYKENSGSPIGYVCEKYSFGINSDGNIYSGCELIHCGCSKGNILNNNLIDLQKKLFIPKVKSKYFLSKTCFLLKEKYGKTLDCFDQKWSDPNYYECHDELFIE